jgi:dihydropyrimidinase
LGGNGAETGMMKKILIKNGLIINSTDTFHGDILVSDGTIAKIGRNIQDPTDHVINAADCYVMPGGIDVHTHLNLSAKGIKVGDGFLNGSAAAAFGGTTCVVEHPGFGPKGCNLLHQLDNYQEAALGETFVDYAFHAVFQHLDAKVLDTLPYLATRGITTIKAYLTYEGRLNDHDILGVLDHAARFGLLPIFHAESDAIINFLTEKLRAEHALSPIFYDFSRPDCCEVEAIQRILYLSEAAGNVPVYIAHVSTRRGLRVIAEARNRGMTVYTEVCPQHLLLDNSCYRTTDNQGLKYIMAPPARTKEDIEALWEGLENGLIDVIASDHCSFNLADKVLLGLKNFSKCPGGIPGVETRLPLIFCQGVLTGKISLTRFVDLVSTTPAKIMGLFPRKGSLAVGADADIVVFDPRQEKIINPSNLQQNADYSPYEGINVRGWPVTTLVRGHLVMHQERLVGEKGFGEYIYRYPTRDIKSCKEMMQ